MLQIGIGNLQASVARQTSPSPEQHPDLESNS
ncbi:hypothetical protein XaFJ1_GM003009 [Xanthomonas albilineans]|nr:hypothetical protein XaFJ1_GM003009 [Xanthomonas albilineans]